MQKVVQISTSRKNEIVDITSIITDELVGVSGRLLNVFVPHTTCAITVVDLDPGTDEDYLMALEAIIPDLNYNHSHNPKHTPDHIKSMLIGVNVTVPIINGELALGTWQSIVLAEFDGPRTRNIVITTT